MKLIENGALKNLSNVFKWAFHMRASKFEIFLIWFSLGQIIFFYHCFAGCMFISYLENIPRDLCKQLNCPSYNPLLQGGTYNYLRELNLLSIGYERRTGSSMFHLSHEFPNWGYLLFPYSEGWIQPCVYCVATAYSRLHPVTKQ